jgi:hypothetical protein
VKSPLDIKKYHARFKEALADLRVITANLSVLIKTVFLGVLGAEICRLSLIAGAKINGWIFSSGYEYWALSVCIGGIAILVSYLMARDVLVDFKKVIVSGRIDVLIAIFFGAWLSVAWNGFFSGWYIAFIASLSIPQLLTITSGPFVLAILIVARSIARRDKKTDSSFVVDVELSDKEGDLLGFASKASSFAERVFNGGSPDSFVFGVDAPWGIGKSTFINFCQQYWRERYGRETVVYKFSPLQHSGTNDLLDVFIDGLIQAIQKDSFVPEIKPLISSYSRLLKEVNRFSIFGLTLPSVSADYTAKDACDDLTVVLRHFNKKIIIVVDDLDRISFDGMKEILFVIRKSFLFPNISYVICYDTDNISALEAETRDTEKISEFLEKFVNIKISLYLDRKDLVKYISENISKALSASTVDPILVGQAIGGLKDIYSSPLYHKYLPFVGDVRKLKRLINTVTLFELQTTDFKNTDFDKRDLINLLLIYIHYPNVFRKIYDTETDGGRGFFSLVIPHEDGYPDEGPGAPRRNSFSDSEYKNSKYYHEYLKELPEGGRQRFLLDQIFNVDVRLKGTGDDYFATRNTYAQIDNVPEDVRTSLACFNGGWTNGRNLETYLDLIVKLAKPEESGQHRFYARWRDEIVSGSKTLKDVFADAKFGYEKGEAPREKLWRIFINNAKDLKKATAASVISYLIESMPEYCLLEIKEVGLGLHQSMDYFLTRLLNDAGWSDPAGEHSNNTEEHIKEIAEWVFGEDSHSDGSVLEKLSAPDRGVLGLYDLMVFRLSCSADRGGDVFDLTRAIALHANPKAPTQGDTRDIAREEMREMSQKVFQIFKMQYIDPKVNIFGKATALQLSDFAGKYSAYLEQKVTEGIINQADVDKKIVEMKTRITSFILYQLGNSEISHGVGCGYYDPSGTKDEHGIRRLMNEYLFTLCFDPSKPENAQYLVDYLFRNFANAIASAREDGHKYIPSINEFTKVLDKVNLADYWQQHRTTIKALKLENLEKVVFVGNDEASYREYVPMVFKVLDDNLAEVQATATKVLAASKEVLSGA